MSPLLPGVLLEQADRVSCGKLKGLHEDPEEQEMGTEQESGLGLSRPQLKWSVVPQRGWDGFTAGANQGLGDSVVSERGQSFGNFPRALRLVNGKGGGENFLAVSRSGYRNQVGVGTTARGRRRLAQPQAFPTNSGHQASVCWSLSCRGRMRQK